MEIQDLTIMISTDQPKVMAKFYESILGLPRESEFKNPVFRAGSAKIRIQNHSDTHGENQMPSRHILNLFISSGIQEELGRLRALKVAVIREPEQESWGGTVSTIQDPDGNYIQIIEGI